VGLRGLLTTFICNRQIIEDPTKRRTGQDALAYSWSMRIQRCKVRPGRYPYSHSIVAGGFELTS
jgi:hypothetical protein